jgi:hypothetical protein
MCVTTTLASHEPNVSSCHEGDPASRGAKSYFYDAENRLTSVNASVFFSYGPDGERVKKSDGLSSTIYLGNDIEYAGGIYTKYLHLDVKRVGMIGRRWTLMLNYSL